MRPLNWWRLRKGSGGRNPYASVDLFEKDSRAPIAYLAFEKRGMRSTWLAPQAGPVAQESALMDLSVFPPPM